MPSTFHVTNPLAPRLAVDENMRVKAEQVRQGASSLSPRATGRLADSWRVEKRNVASYSVSTDVPYAPYVEYGTKFMRAVHMLGRAVARERRI